ncbi:bifunctional aspartate transaminase/aspartate 4-decarboxylase [Longispora urticae]
MTDAALSRAQLRRLSELSPFELEREQIARALSAQVTSGRPVLDAGRGNPNWIATGPREAYFALGQFALTESRRVWTADNLGGMPTAKGAAARFGAFADAHPGLPGIVLLRACVDYGIRELDFGPDEWVHELVDAVIGDNYPEPNRILRHCERVVRDYLAAELCAGRPPAGTFDVFATEGGTAAMCYLFDSLMVNRVLREGDRIALMTPLFPPYVEIPQLARYDFDVVRVAATPEDPAGLHTWFYPDAEIDKLADPAVKALFLVNPANPASIELSGRTRDRIVDIVATSNPGLVIITDDVYATFVPGFTSLAAAAPYNTALVYSYSKHYGATGQRLGVIALHEDNVVDRLIAELPAADTAALAARYRTLSLDPGAVKFVDRLVADSRQVALRHTSGLSGPQQAQLMLFSLFNQLPEGQDYKQLLRDTVHRRLELLAEGAEVTFPPDAKRAAYYVEIDILDEAHRHVDPAFAEYLQASYEPADLLFRLADQYSVVLLNGSGFDGPAWSVRVSLANLNDLDYLKIGHHLRAVLDGYLAEWRASTGKAD